MTKVRRTSKDVPPLDGTQRSSRSCFATPSHLGACPECGHSPRSGIMRVREKRSSRAHARGRFAKNFWKLLRVERFDIVFESACPGWYDKAVSLL